MDRVLEKQIAYWDKMLSVIGDRIDVAAGIRGTVKAMFGGAPLTGAYAELIGSDGFAGDASAAVRATKQLLGQSPTSTAAEAAK